MEERSWRKESPAVAVLTFGNEGAIHENQRVRIDMCAGEGAGVSMFVLGEALSLSFPICGVG